MRRHSLGAFFVLAYALSWAAWAPLVVAPGRAVAGSPWSVLHFAGLMGPALAALVVASLAGPPSWPRLRARLTAARGRARWLLVGGLMPFGLFLLAGAGLRLAGQSVAFEGLGSFPKLPGVGLVAAWAVLLVTAAGEELGWRAFALPRLQRHRSALKATALLVPAWALWHLPMFVYDPVFSAMGAAGAAGWLASLVAGGVILTWLLNASGGSVLPCVLFHGATNAVFMSSAGEGTAGGVAGALFMVTAVLVLLARGRELGR